MEIKQMSSTCWNRSFNVKVRTNDSWTILSLNSVEMYCSLSGGKLNCIKCRTSKPVYDLKLCDLTEACKMWSLTRVCKYACPGTLGYLPRCSLMVWSTEATPVGIAGVHQIAAPWSTPACHTKSLHNRYWGKYCTLSGTTTISAAAAAGSPSASAACVGSSSSSWKLLWRRQFVNNSGSVSMSGCYAATGCSASIKDAGVEPIPCLRQPLSLPLFNFLLLRWSLPVPRLFDLPSPTEVWCAESNLSTMLAVCPPLGGAVAGCSTFIEGNPNSIVIGVVLLW